MNFLVIIGAVVLGCFLGDSFLIDGTETVSIVKQACLEGSRFVVRDACEDKNPSATADFTNEVNITGWSYLEIVTSSKFTDEQQAYAAGLVEAAATRPLIVMQWTNTIAGYCKGAEDYCVRLKKFLRKNLDWMRSQINQNQDDPYWKQVKLALIQLAGLEDGYNDLAWKQPHMDVDPFGLLLFQINGELEELERALDKPKHLRRKVLGSGSCSALMKPVDEDLLFSHVTWSTYQGMLRILKLYKLAYSNSSLPGRTISMSSYPATLISIDDFYLTTAQLAITETTIGCDNDTLIKQIKPQDSVSTWIRSLLATRLASSGEQWMTLFAKYNSGTYNNQWMVVDYKNYKPSQDLPDKGLFFVLEQLPGTAMWKDMTSVLKAQGYWPSYNVPYFPEVFNLSGQWENVKKYGDWFTYQKNPRAQIFKRDQAKVTDIDSLRTLMRYNDFKNDPLSKCNCTPPYSAENAISSRNDLNSPTGKYPFQALSFRSHGGTDMKATSLALIEKLMFMAVSGPTWDQQPPFKWSTSGFNASDTPHVGHPDEWKFDPILHAWKNL